MYRYNPFSKPIDEIVATDLEVLKDVPEGWYVEYKGEMPNGRSIAKSISAFANTYGGWLFYGVKESGDGRRVAGALDGIAVKDVPAADQAIRQAVSSLISPTPHFETRIVYGEAESAVLAEGRAIIVIGVPAGNNAPYVHGSGVIYRRVADASEPRAETDRHFLDLLWERGKATRKEFSKFIKRTPKLSKNESSKSSLRICLFPDPWGERQIRSKMEFSQYADFMGDRAHGGITFDNVFTTRNGFIARHAHNNNPTDLLYSWRYYRDCTSEIVLPFGSTWVDNIRDAINYLDGYEYSKGFLKKCFDMKMSGFALVDISQLYSIIVDLFYRKRALLAAENLPWNISYKAQVNNFWRRVPYVDLEEMPTFVEKFGIPISQNKTAYVPAGTDPDSCWELSPPDRVGDENPDTSLQVDATVLFLNICKAMGLPLDALGMNSGAEKSDALTRLLQLGQRAQEVTRNRGEDN